MLLIDIDENRWRLDEVASLRDMLELTRSEVRVKGEVEIWSPRGGWSRLEDEVGGCTEFLDLARDWSSSVRASTSNVRKICSESVGNKARTVYDASS